MIKKTLVLTSIALLALVIWIISDSDSNNRPSPAEEPDHNTQTLKQARASNSIPFVTSTQKPIQAREPEPNPRWLDPIILHVLNSETTWNDSGTEKRVISIVEADFHHPYLRIEETYAVDLNTGEETLLKYVPSTADTILLELHPNTTNTGIEELETSLGIQIKTVLRGTNILKAKIENFLSVDRIPDLIKSLISTSSPVSMAEPDFLCRTFQRLPNDPLLERQYGFDAAKKNGENRDLDAPEAWEVRTDASSIVVAVIDSGLNLNHHDLKNNLWRNPQELANGIDDDGNGIIDDIHGVNFIADNGNPEDDNGHGTLVAGVIGAEGNNGVGIAGIAWDVQLMGLKHTNKSGIGLYSDAIEALRYAIDQKVDIINNSWGGSGYSRLLEGMLQEASNQGIIIATAAGNDGNLLSDVPIYPAAYEIANQVVVGATDEHDNLADFSNYDPSLVHIMAPEGAFSTWHQGVDAYRYEVGTSFSTPFVAGSFALLKAHMNDLDSQGLIDRLLEAGEHRVQLTDRCLSQSRLNSHRGLAGLSNIPQNDYFDDAIEIDSEGGTESGSLVYGTLQEEESLLFPDMDPNSVWYRWTSPRSGTVFLELKAPRFQGSLGVYKGDALDQLEAIASDQSGSEGLPSKIEFQSQEGESFRIQVGRQSGLGGYFTLSLALAPPNDDLVNSSELSGTSFEATGALALSTQEQNEPVIHPSGSGKTVWYHWTAPRNGTLFLTVNSFQGQLFANAFKDLAGELEPAEVTFDQGHPNRLLFTVSSGNRYLFGVTAQSTSTDLFSLEGSYLESPRFTIEPPDTSSRAGTDVVLNVGVLGLGNPTYQWYFNNLPIDGATHSFLLLADFQAEDEGEYYVKVRITGIELQSRTARLSLTEADIRILQNPESRILTTSSSINLSVFAEPKGLLTYQWYKDGKRIPNQTTSTLRINDSGTNDTGFYHVDIILGGEFVSSKTALVRIVEGDSSYAGTPWTDTEFGTPYIQKVVSAGDYIFALSDEGKIGFSKDGKNWHYTSIYQGLNNNWVVYGNEKYVLATDNGVYWSTDPFHWIKSSATARSNQIAFGNNVFIIATSKGISRSTNGETWTQVHDPSAPENEAVVWAGDRFIVINRDEDVFFSSDGLTWEILGKANYHRAEDLIYLNEKVWTTRPSLGFSSDGLSWTLPALPEGGGGILATDIGEGGEFLTNGSDIWELDGNEWRLLTPPLPNFVFSGPQMINGQAVGIKAGRPILLTGPVTDTGYPPSLQAPLFANGKFISGRYTTSNGIDWLIETPEGAFGAGGDDVAYGNGVYVFGNSWGGNLGTLQKHAYEFLEIEFGNGVFVAADREHIYKSQDGSAWESVVTVEANSKHKLIFANGKFLHLDAAGIRTSEDGQTWTVHEGAAPPDLNHLIYEDGLYLGVHRFGASKTSTDGITWGAEVDITIPGHSDLVTGVTFFDGRFFVLNNGILFESRDAQVWTALSSELFGYDAVGLLSGNGRMLTITEAGPVVWNTGDNSAGPNGLFVYGETPGSTVLIGQELTFSIEAFSQSGAIETISLYEGGELVSEINPPQSTMHYRVSRPGSHDLHFKVTDEGGNTFTKNLTIQGVRPLLSRELGAVPIFNDLIYFKGAFYGAGPGGIVYQSLNGQDWNRIQTPSTRNLNGFYVAPAGLCVVGVPDILMFSENGIHWKRIPLGESIRHRPQTIENSFFVIPSTDEIAWLSNNGVEWYSMKTGQLIAGAQDSANPVQPSEFIGAHLGRPGEPAIELRLNGNEIRNFSSLVVGNRLILVKHFDGVYSTTDGKNWEKISLPEFNNGRGRVQDLGNSLFLIEGEAGKDSAVSYFSTDGVNWESAQSPTFIGNIVFKDGNYYMGNELSFYRSADGVNWEKIGKGPFPYDYEGENAELVSSPKGFISFSKAGGQDANYQFSYSSDGVNWSRETAISHYSSSNIIEGSNDLYVTPRERNYQRNELKNWVPSNAEFPYDFLWKNGIFLSQQENPGTTYLRSEDSLTWTEVAYPSWMSGKTFSPLIRDANRAFWLSYNHFSSEPEKNFLAKSNDGLTWERIPHPKPTDDPSVIFEFGNWIYLDRYRSEDSGKTWEEFLPGVAVNSIAATDSKLLLITHNPANAQIFDGQSWQSAALPETREPLFLLSSEDTFFFITYDWIYASQDGISWEPVAQNDSSSSDKWYSVADNTLFQIGEGTSIGEFSENDLAIDSFNVTDGAYGVGDIVETSFMLINYGRKPIRFPVENPLEIEYLLSQRAGIWGNGPDGHSVSDYLPLQSLELDPGASSTMVIGFEVPDSVQPGAYYLSARIKNQPLLGDPISANDYIIANEATITIPERTLQIIETGNGEVTSDTTLAKIPFKKSIRLVPNAFFGHEFSVWTGDLESNSEVATIIMDTNKQVEANFVPRNFNVEVRILGNGTVLGIPENGYAAFEDQIALEAIASEGSNFLGWAGDRISQESTLSFRVGRDIRLIARFAQNLASWLAERYSAQELLDPDIGGPLGDPDRNGFTNLQEFLFGIDRTTGIPPRFEIFRDGEDICLVYPRSLTTIGDAYLEARYSHDLAGWQTDGLEQRVIRQEAAVEYVEIRKHSPGMDPLFFGIRAVAE